MSIASNGLASFVPRTVRQLLNCSALRDGEAQSFDLSGVVLFADIAGFTGVVERLATQGALGTETLGKLLDRHFSAANAIVYGHGGDIFNYLGDAILAIWPSTYLGTAESAKTAAIAAGEIARLAAEVAGISLRMRVAVAMGAIRGMVLGGHQAKWTWTASGKPIDFVTQRYHEIEPGDVIADHNVANLLGAAHVVELMADGAARLDLSNTNHLDRPNEASRENKATSLNLNAKTLQSLLPTAAASQILHGGGDWVGEFRQSAQLFVRIPGLTLDALLLDIQRSYAAIQKAVLATEGTPIDAFLTQDGLLVFAVFGLPPLAHEDDALRAVQAAFLMQDAFSDLQVELDIGISAGRTYSGVIGDSMRRNLSVLGVNVVLAARLMEQGGGRILATVEVQQRTTGVIDFEAPASMHIRGYDDLVQIVTPVRQHSLVKTQSPSVDIVGRDGEISRFCNIHEQVRSQAQGAALLLQGEPGVGKTRLLLEFRRIAEGCDTTVISAAGARLEKLSSFRVWRLIVREMLKFSVDYGLILKATDSELSDAFLKLDDFAYQRNRRVLGSPEQHEGDTVRIVEQAVLILALRLASVKPILLLIDEGHWMDSASWRMSQVVCQSCPRLMLVCGFRPPEAETRGGALREAIESFVRLPLALLLKLSPLSREAAMHIARSRLNQVNLPMVLENTIWERSQGNPLFVEEMVALVRTRLRETDNSLVRSAKSLLTSVSANLESLITARIDRLDAGEKFTLKIASVIGRVVTIDLLTEIHPSRLTRVELIAQIEKLKRADLFQDGETGGTVVFKHPLIQQVTYNMMTVAARRQAHKQIALWALKGHNAESVGWNNVVLSYHLEKAGDYARALNVLERCAMDALSDFANAEALGFRERAQACIDNGDLRLPVTTLGHWARIEGQAYCSLGDNPKAKAAFLQGLTLLNMPMPRNNRSLVIGIIRELAKQLASRLNLHRPIMTDDQTLADAVEILLRMARVHYFFGERLSLIYSLLKCVNLAERLTSQIPFMAVHYATVGAVAGTIPIHTLAHRYLDKAESLIDQETDPWVICHTLLARGLYMSSVCEWAEAARAFNRGLEITEAQRDYRVWSELAVSYDVVAGVGLFTSKTLPFDRLRKMNTQLVERNRQRKDAQLESCAWLALARSAWLLGDQDAFVASIKELNTLLRGEPEKIEPTVKIEAPAFEARLLMRQGAPASKVFAVLTKGVDALRANPALVKARNAVSYFSLCDSQLDAFERWPSSSWTLVHEQELTFSLNILRNFSRRYRLAQPFAVFIMARNAIRNTNKGAAKTFLRRAIEKSRRYELPWLEARAWLLLATLDTQGAETALSNARSLLTKIDLVWPVPEYMPAMRMKDSTQESQSHDFSA